MKGWKMSEQKGTIKGRRGRPRIEDQQDILLYFANGLAHGMTVRQLSEHGLTLQGFEQDQNGNWFKVPKRTLKGETLERRYRTLRQQVKYARNPFAAISGALSFKARGIGIQWPLAEKAIAPLPHLKPGRPRIKSQKR